MLSFSARFPAVFLALCAAGALAQSAPALVPFSSATGHEPPPPWRAIGLPHSLKPLTHFDITPVEGRPVLRVQANRSYANLVHELADAVPAPGTQLRWRWRLEQPLLEADLQRRETDDSPLKLCLLFDMPLERLDFTDRSLLQAMRALTAEKVPTATLCYVWDHRLPVGTLLNNAYTSRLRFLVVDSGEQRLGQWVSHQRDVAADFQRAFGRESPTLVPLDAVMVGADADNTGGQSLGYVGDVTLGP